MITRRAPARRWGSVLSLVRNTPVDSMTTSAPTSPQADAAGSLTAVVRIGRPPTTRRSPLTATSPRNRPRTKRVWFLVLPRTGVLDVAGAWEVLGHANDVLGRPAYQLEMVSPSAPTA